MNQLDGLVFIDTGGTQLHVVYNAIKKEFPNKPLHTAIYTYSIFYVIYDL